MILFKGIFLGLLIAVPVGPVGLLCFQRTLSRGRLSGFISGLGAATADAFYGSVAAFGLVVISDFLVRWQVALRVIGGIFLLYIGLNFLFRKKTVEAEVTESSGRLVDDYLSTFLLTITNPATILSFAVLFGGIGFVEGHFMAALTLVIGVFLGSTFWWLILSYGLSSLRGGIGNLSVEKISKFAGILIIVFAFVILVNVVFRFFRF